MANLKDLIVNGVSRFIGKVYIDDSRIEVINNSTVGDDPKFTDTTYATVSTSGNAGLMSTADKVKLNSIAASATRNTFSAFTGAPTSNQTPGFGSTFNIYQVGQTTAGAITTTARTVTIPGTDATTAAHGLLTAADKIKLNALTTADATTSAHGYLTAADKIKLNTLSTVDNDTTYALATTAANGLLRQLNGSTVNYLRRDGTWVTPPDNNTTYGNATTAAAGLMTADDKKKLNSIASSATRNTFSAFTGAPTSNQTPGFGSTFNIYQVGQTTAGAITTTARTVKIPNTAATTAAAGLMSAADKIKLNNCSTGSSLQYVADGTSQSVLLGNVSKNKATEQYSIAEGNQTTASGHAAHAEGRSTLASGSYAHAEGEYTQATGHTAHAEGGATLASGYQSHAEGNASSATGDSSHAEGYYTLASTLSAHAQGQDTQATGYCAHAEGNATTASGFAAHAEGEGTIAKFKVQHVFGQYNIADPSTATSDYGKYIEIVGNGTTASRSNARTLDWYGNEILTGGLICWSLYGKNLTILKPEASLTNFSTVDMMGGFNTRGSSGETKTVLELCNISTVDNTPKVYASIAPVYVSSSETRNALAFFDSNRTGTAWYGERGGYIDSGANNMKGYIVHGANVNNKMTISCDTNSKYVAFYADGNAVGAIYVGGSDSRIKKDIEPLSNKYKKAISKVEFKDFHYDFKDDVLLSKSNNYLRFGVIAQDIIAALKEENIPEQESELIDTLKDEINGERYIVNYTSFLVTRLAADEDRIKQLEETVKNLTTRLEALEQK